MVAMLAAGYLGPALVGVAAAVALGAGWSLAVLWGYLLLLAVLLLKIRNFYGVLVIVVAGLGLVAVSWYLSVPAQSTIAYLITWVLLLASPKPVLEVARHRTRGRARGWAGRSDVDQLARLTRMPAAAWTGFFLFVTVAGLLVGTVLLLPGVASLAQTIPIRLGT